MAGLPWFELDVDMPDDPKVAGLVARLKNPCAGWYVVRLYAYCYKHAQDRFSGPGAPATIEDTAARWKGKTGVLLSALVAEGFVDHGEGDTLIVHGVENRLAPHLAKRERDAERLRERRANVARSSQRRSGGVAGDKDKYKEEEKTADSLTLVPLLPEVKPATKSKSAVDPLRRTLSDSLVAAFGEERGGSYGFDGVKDAEGVKRLLTFSRDVADHVRRWRLALNAPAGNYSYRVDTIAAFATGRIWNHFPPAEGVAPAKKVYPGIPEYR